MCWQMIIYVATSNAPNQFNHEYRRGFQKFILNKYLFKRPCPKHHIASEGYCARDIRDSLNMGLFYQCIILIEQFVFDISYLTLFFTNVYNTNFIIKSRRFNIPHYHLQPNFSPVIYHFVFSDICVFFHLSTDTITFSKLK